METIMIKIFSQWGFGAALAIIVIVGLFWLLKDILKKLDKQQENHNSLINAGLATLEKMNLTLDRSIEDNKQAHSYQKEEHDRLERRMLDLERAVSK